MLKKTITNEAFPVSKFHDAKSSLNLANLNYAFKIDEVYDVDEDIDDEDDDEEDYDEDEYIDLQTIQNQKPKISNTILKKKKTKGRVKINMEFIEDKTRRYTTFSKRKTGIMKKAYELSTLTGTQVMLLVASETGHVYTFATEKLQPMITSDAGKSLIQSCLNSRSNLNKENERSKANINTTFKNKYRNTTNEGCVVENGHLSSLESNNNNNNDNVSNEAQNKTFEIFNGNNNKDDMQIDSKSPSSCSSLNIRNDKVDNIHLKEERTNSKQNLNQVTYLIYIRMKIKNKKFKIL
jgi:hypothetical protein